MPGGVPPSQPRCLEGKRYRRRCSVTTHSLRLALELFQACPNNGLNHANGTLVSDEEDSSPPLDDATVSKSVKSKAPKPKVDRKRLAPEDYMSSQELLNESFDNQQSPKKLQENRISAQLIYAKKQKTLPIDYDWIAFGVGCVVFLKMVLFNNV